ncbi:MAG: diacylglycerol kinase family lipid kinase [Geobacter sp.]|nr:diacylglycerol kinase family lipid kinase [Geobacter sp.]
MELALPPLERQPRGSSVKRCVIIANKGAGSFSTKLLDAACRRLGASGREVEVIACGDFSEITATAAQRGKSEDGPLIIAAGGDGTINAVFSGLAGCQASCAILPLGTANVLAIELGMKSAEAAVERIIAGNLRPLTAGAISNQQKNSRFFLMAGMGFDGRVVRGVTPELKHRLGKGAYILSALRSLASWESGEMEVTVNGTGFSCHSLVVCNAAYYGGQLKLAPGASLFAPSFELIAVTDCSRRGVAALTAAALSGGESRAIRRLTAGEIRIEGFKPVQLDGDNWGDAPVTIVAEPGYLNLIS